MAEANPIGNAKSIAPAVTSTVPVIRGSAPYSLSEGFHVSPVRNSKIQMFFIAPTLLLNMKSMIKTMIRTVTEATPMRTYLMILSWPIFFDFLMNPF